MVNNLNNKETTMIDRLSIALGSAVITFITAAILWSIYRLFFGIEDEGLGAFFPFYWVGLFAGLGFVLGFLTLENYLLSILAPIWSFVYRYVSGLFIW